MNFLPKTSVPKFLMLCTFSLLAAAGLTDTYLQSRNTLERNGRWIDSRLEMVGMFVDTLAFMRTRLPSNLLNLGEESKYAEVLYRHQIQPGRIAFDFQFRGKSHISGSYIICVFNKDEKGFEGIRLNSDGRSGNLYFVANPGGQFLDRQNLEPAVLRPGWNRLAVLESSDGLEVSVNSAHLGTVSTRFKTGLVGIRGYGKPVQVDNIRFEDGRGKTLDQETFSHWRCLHGGTLWSVILLAILAIGLSWRWVGYTSSLRPVWVSCFLAVSWWSLSYLNFVFPLNRPAAIPTVGTLWQFEEGNELRNAAIQWNQTFPKLTANNGFDYGGPVPDPALKPFRILCLASSQMAGLGAASLEETFIRRVETELAKDAPAGRRYEFVLEDAPLMEGADIIDVYERRSNSQSFDGLIVGLNPEREDLQNFEGRLSRFLKANAQKLPIVIVCSAGTPPSWGEASPWPPFIKKVGAQYGVPVVDLYDYLQEHHDDGLLWWDYTHATSFGQELMTKHFMETLRSFDGYFSKFDGAMVGDESQKVRDGRT